jgi:hypothetical protein
MIIGSAQLREGRRRLRKAYGLSLSLFGGGMLRNQICCRKIIDLENVPTSSR